MSRFAPHINKFLLPFSWLYGFGVWFRNKLFDWGVYRTEEFPIPVISVGNITVGGTGKTPHIEYLIRLLRKEYRIAVLSRGYKRKTKGFVLAGDTSTSKEIGDESYQIWRKFPDILVAVDRKRANGIRRLLALDEARRPEIILLDDAFQHRYVTPSLSILLVDINRLIYEDYLLPAGRLREPVGHKNRANMVLVTKCTQDLKPIDYRVISKHLNLYPYQSLFFTSWKYGRLRPVFASRKAMDQDLDDIRDKKISVLLVSGIANPGQLEAEIKPYASTMDKMEYPDHYSFSSADLVKMRKRFEQLPGDRKIILTTEKDAARLVNRKGIDEVLKKNLYYLPIQVSFIQEDANEFNQKIIEHVRTFKRNRILD